MVKNKPAKAIRLSPAIPASPAMAALVGVPIFATVIVVLAACPMGSASWSCIFWSLSSYVVMVVYSLASATKPLLQITCPLPATQRRSFPDIIANTNINIRAIPRHLTFDTSISSTARRCVGY